MLVMHAGVFHRNRVLTITRLVFLTFRNRNELCPQVEPGNKGSLGLCARIQWVVNENGVELGHSDNSGKGLLKTASSDRKKPSKSSQNDI